MAERYDEWAKVLEFSVVLLNARAIQGDIEYFD